VAILPLAPDPGRAENFADEEAVQQVSSQIATTIRERAIRRPRSAMRRDRRMVGIQLLGPLTILGGIVWAIAQPWRIAFLYPAGKGFYDYVAQPPLLVVVVGLVFVFFVAPGLVEDLERGDRGPQG
jgi:hypothetical protein